MTKVITAFRQLYGRVGKSIFRRQRLESNKPLRLLLLITLIMTFSLCTMMAQNNNSVIITSRSEQDTFVVSHTQKSIYYSFNEDGKTYYRSITLTHYNLPEGGERSAFCLSVDTLTDPILTSAAQFRYLDFPPKWKVQDIALLGDTLYFCGQLITEEEITGFLAYVGINSLFTTSVYPVYYSTTAHIFNRLEVFYDPNQSNQRCIWAMGSRKGEDYRDIVVAYYVQNNSSNPCRTLTSQYDTMNERFQDITVSIGCTELASLWYNRSTNPDDDNPIYASDGTELSPRLYCRMFDTGTSWQYYHLSNYLDIQWYNDTDSVYFDTTTIKGIFNVKLEFMNNRNTTGNDTFAICFNHYTDSSPRYYASIANKIKWNVGINAAALNFLLSTRFEEDTYAKKIWDLEYINQTPRSLLVLSEGNVPLFTPRQDVLYDLDFSRNYKVFSISAPTYTYNPRRLYSNHSFLNEEYPNANFIHWNHILSLPDNMFRLSGNLQNSQEWGDIHTNSTLSFFQFERKTESECFILENPAVKETPYPLFGNHGSHEYDLTNEGNKQLPVNVIEFNLTEKFDSNGYCLDDNIK